MAGRVQLATRGTQDVFFTDDPEYTYFIKNFKKHTNFARYTMNHDVNGELEFGQTLRCTIPQNSGDLIRAVRLRFTLKGANPLGYVESIGHAVIEHVDLNIGGKLIQRIPRDWLQIYSEHYVTQTKQTNLSKLIGKPPYEFSGTPVNIASNPPSNNILTYISPTTQERTCIVDVPFYFHGNPELAVPLCAITQQEIEIVVKLNSSDKCTYEVPNTVSPTTQKGLIKSFQVQTELVALDDLERVKFQEVPTDFIITQVQSDVSRIPDNETVHKHKLEFVNPVKELYFVIQRVGADVSVFDYDDVSHVDGSRYTNYEHLRNLQLTLNSETVLDEISGKHDGSSQLQRDGARVRPPRPREGGRGARPLQGPRVRHQVHDVHERRRAVRFRARDRGGWLRDDAHLRVLARGRGLRGVHREARQR